ncbi:MAG: carboxypeptidase-like regulatory domain-containing protein [Pyrinomonadaceae bacterium]
MRKLFLGALIIVAITCGATAQQPTTTNTTDIPNMGRKPDGPNGLGRLDARVFDEAGQPFAGALIKLESSRTDGFFCESWNSSDERGVAVLPPIHMGSLRVTVKAKGYETQKLNVDPATLGEPVRITLKKNS